MRLAFDARTIQDHFPGIGRYTFNLLRALAATDGAADLQVLHDPRQANTRFDLAQLSAPNLRLVPVPAPNFSLQEQWRVPAVLRTLRADVYHSSYIVMPYRPSRPAIVTVYDLIPLRCPRDYSLKVRLAYRAAAQLALAAAERVITISSHSARDLQQLFGVPAGKLAIVLAAADPMFRPQPPEAVEQLRARLGLPGEYALYFGSNKPHKNLPRLVRAFGQLRATGRRTPLVIAGHWDERFPAARQLVEAHGWQDRVKFLGPVAQADLPALYAGAVLFAYPSTYEGFGLPVLEALACGTPVACADATTLPEVAGEAAAYFDPLEVESIALVLDRALSDADLRQDLARRGLQRAAQFTWARSARETWSVYESVMRSKN